MIGNPKIKMLGLCLISMLAIGVAYASSASAATHNPEFRWCQEKAEGKFENSECSKEGKGKWELLGKLNTETEVVEGKTVTTQKFTLTIVGSKATVTCKAANLKEGKIFGGEGEKGNGWGGAGEGVVVFEGCTLEGVAGCKVSEKVETTPLSMNLVFASKEAAEKEKQEVGEKSQALIWVRPKLEKEKGVQIFVKGLVIEGSGCIIKGTYTIETEQNEHSHDCCLGLELGRPEAEHTETHEVEFNTKTQTVFFANEKEKAIEWTTNPLKAKGVETINWEGKMQFALKGKDRWWEVD